MFVYLGELDPLLFAEMVRPALKDLHHLCAALDLRTYAQTHRQTNKQTMTNKANGLMSTTSEDARNSRTEIENMRICLEINKVYNVSAT
jgi:hypothetical protein